MSVKNLFNSSIYNISIVQQVFSHSFVLQDMLCKCLLFSAKNYFRRKCYTYVETDQLICNVNQLTVFCRVWNWSDIGWNLLEIATHLLTYIWSTYGTKYSGMEKVKFVEAKLQKIVLGPFLNALSHIFVIIIIREAIK